MYRPSSSHEALLSSITSTELRKITFSVWIMDDWRSFEVEMELWTVIDQQLCRLVDRLCATGYRFTLEAELQLMEIGDDPGKYDFTLFLPGFSEKGIVVVIDAVHDDRILYSNRIR